MKTFRDLLESVLVEKKITMKDIFNSQTKQSKAKSKLIGDKLEVWEPINTKENIQPQLDELIVDWTKGPMSEYIYEEFGVKLKIVKKEIKKDIVKITLKIK